MSLPFRFDFIVIAVALIATIVEVGLGLAASAEERTLDFVLVFRALRLIRLAGSIERYAG